MRYLLLRSSPLALQQEMFSTLLNSHPFERGPYPQLAHLTLADMIRNTPQEDRSPSAVMMYYYASEGGTYSVPFPYRNYVNTLARGGWAMNTTGPHVDTVHMLNNPGDFATFARQFVKTACLPILHIVENVNWQQTRREFMPQIESLLESWGIPEEVEYASVASNWKRHAYNISSLGTNVGMSGVTLERVHSRWPDIHARYASAVRRLSLT